IFRGLLEAGPFFSNAPVPEAPPGYALTWTLVGRGAAVATFSYLGLPVTTSALLGGVDPFAEADVTAQLQAMIARLFAGAPIEPDLGMAGITQRPAIASLLLPKAYAAGRHAVALIADLETCLMGAFLETLPPPFGGY